MIVCPNIRNGGEKIFFLPTEGVRLQYYIAYNYKNHTPFVLIHIVCIFIKQQFFHKLSLAAILSDIFYMQKQTLKFSLFPILFYLTFISGCTNSTNENHGGWTPYNSVELKKRNFLFSFPADGYAYDNRDSLVQLFLKAVDHDLTVIKEAEFKDTIRVQFVRSRQEMKKFIGFAPSGTIFPQHKTIYYVANENEQPPIIHELMHMIVVLKWGELPYSSFWLNEGLATYSENNCNGFKVEEIYTYFANKKMLLPLDSLAADFYSQPEMVAYHQSAYVVQFLIDSFGVDKLKQLWKEGFNSFEKIYGTSYKNVENEIDNKLKEKYHKIPNINWDTFKEGCK